VLRAGTAIREYSGGGRSRATPSPLTNLKGKRMPEITINTNKIMSSPGLFDDLIWKLVKEKNPEKTAGSVWYGKEGIHVKIRELWELIK